MSRLQTLMAGALAAAAVCVPLSAFAQEGLPQTLDMSCSQAQSLVYHNGAAVLATGPLVFNRYVTGMNYCALGDVTRLTWVRTHDASLCPVGYVCHEPSNDGGQ